MEHDLAEVDSFIGEEKALAERYRPCEGQDLEAPVSDTALLVLFTSWRGRALRFVQIQTGSNSEFSQAFSRECGARGSYGDLTAGIRVLERVREGILGGAFKRKRIELFISHPGTENP